MTVEELTELLLQNEQEAVPELWPAFTDFIFFEDGSLKEDNIEDLKNHNYEVIMIKDALEEILCVNLIYDHTIFFQILNPAKEESDLDPETESEDDEPIEET